MDILILLIALFIGCAVGIVTGLIPGIHVNTIAILVLAVLPFLSKYFSPLALAILFISMCIVHSFLDFIPSVFMGAPD